MKKKLLMYLCDEMMKRLFLAIFIITILLIPFFNIFHNVMNESNGIAFWIMISILIYCTLLLLFLSCMFLNYMKIRIYLICKYSLFMILDFIIIIIFICFFLKESIDESLSILLIIYMVAINISYLLRKTLVIKKDSRFFKIKSFYLKIFWGKV